MTRKVRTCTWNSFLDAVEEDGLQYVFVVEVVLPAGSLEEGDRILDDLRGYGGVEITGVQPLEADDDRRL